MNDSVNHIKLEHLGNENIKQEPIENPGDNVKVENTNCEQETKVKKKRFEIELDETLLNKWLKPRERRKVVKYEDISLLDGEISKKKKEVTDRQKTLFKNRLDRVTYNIGEEQFVCDICNLPFMTIQALIGHKKKHLKIIKYKCALCNEKFDTNKDLIKHKTAHENEDRIFLCKKCNSCYTDHLEYLKHKLTHQQLQQYQCIECNKKYANKTGFRIHIETHFDMLNECEICHIKIKRYHFNQHLKVHAENSKLTCVECGKVYFKKESLNYHMISHTGLKLFQCLFCGKCFSNNSQRSIHTRIHTGEQPFECHVCHQKFKQKIDMDRHLESHQPEKTIICNVCNKRFLHKDSLKYHMDLHNNTQRYKCHICDKRITTNTGLRDHLIRVHSEGENIHCEACDKYFKTSSDYLKHTKLKNHKNKQYGFDMKMKNAK